ncbi:MAG: hypothetical protein HQL08_02375 [Nitrospirae bacterium]|nr:hypothetical protein [Nitrospirota bacterium]
MANTALEEVDRIDDMEREDTKKKLPIGWLLLYIGLIIWGIYYAVSFTPEISGWSQAREYTESIKK